VIKLANKDLKNRHPFSNSINNDLWKKLNEINQNTGVPLSKLLDKAIELLVKESTK
jgi:uncharacterized linocin/CFP29 family protein